MSAEGVPGTWSGAGAAAPAGRNRWLILVVIAIAQLMIVLDSTRSGFSRRRSRMPDDWETARTHR
jgi:hypothetical protein